MNQPNLIAIDGRHSSAAPRPITDAGARRSQSGVEPYRVHIETFGCQMNEYDSDLVRSLLASAGFSFTDDKERADVVLMNTCAIRENAHNRVYGHLAELRPIKKQRNLVVGVLGCMAQNLKNDLLEAESSIDVLVGPDGYRRLPELIHRAIASWGHGTALKGLSLDLSEYETYEDIVPDQHGGVNGWIAVMRGCDNFCTFCVVPYTRGRERSRDPEGILREARLLAAHGSKQVTLLGQNVNSYRYDGWDFARLITAVADVDGIERVRFMSPHPKDFPPALLDAVAEHPKICKQIHLPLQSGSDRILHLMGRSYTRKDYLSLVEAIHARRAGIVLSTDIICGFCTEREDEFLATYRTVQEVGYHLAFVFKYSERKHTIASRKYPDDIPDSVKAERVTKVVELQKAISLGLNQKMVDRTVPVLVEGDAKRSSDQWMGRTDGGITVVWQKQDLPGIAQGDLISVRVIRASATTLFGRPQHL
jgi:tRNA-2-methylthio-N6-dimethylallyladenosine synthase